MRDFERRAQGTDDQRFDYVRRFFHAWDERYTTGDRAGVLIGEDSFDFWRERWAESHPAPSTPSMSKATKSVLEALERKVVYR